MDGHLGITPVIGKTKVGSKREVFWQPMELTGKPLQRERMRRTRLPPLQLGFLKIPISLRLANSVTLRLQMRIQKTMERCILRLREKIQR